MDILDSLEEGVCVLDGGLRITHLNTNAARICGGARGELIGRSFREAGPGLAGDGLLHALEDSLGDGCSRRVEPAGNAATGRMEISIHPSGGGLWLILREGSSRQTIEQQLRERDEILTMAEQSAGLGVWDIDLAAGTVRGTAQFWRVMGLPPTEEAVPIETTRQLRLPGDRERVAKGFNAVVANHAESFEMEYRIRRPDGQIRWIFGRGRLIRDGAGRPVRYSGIDIDVTERKFAEAALADLNQALENRVRERTAALEAEMARRAEAEERLHHAQKMETIGQLSGGIAHDFNNLLTVISGNIEALERHLPAGEARLHRFTEAAMRGTRRATALTNRLLAFARRQALEPKLLEVNQLVLGMADLLHRTLGERIAVRMRLADRLGPVFADPNQLENAILNLVVNARDAMPEGGTLAIEAASANAANESGAREGSLRSSYVKISVSDTGSGMTADVQARAFEPFFTTKQPGGGTGLGLAQVYGFIKQSGGLCLIDSQIGKGTTVSLYLPRAGPSEALQPASNRPPAALAHGRGEIILVAEDDPEVRAYSADLLRELSYQVLTAADAAAALHALEENPGVRLLFTDVVLPGPLNGRQLAEIAITRHPALKVLLTTGYANDALSREGWLDPGMELIAKPFTSAGLSAKIRSVLQH